MPTDVEPHSPAEAVAMLRYTVVERDLAYKRFAEEMVNIAHCDARIQDLLDAKSEMTRWAKTHH